MEPLPGGRVGVDMTSSQSSAPGPTSNAGGSVNRTDWRTMVAGSGQPTISHVSGAPWTLGDIHNLAGPSSATQVKYVIDTNAERDR